MGSIERFEIEFVKRTKEILESYNGTHTFSNLINCTLGLIILPYENIEGGDFWDVLITDIDLFNEGQIIVFEPMTFDKKLKKVITLRKSLINFVTKLRHGLAHQNITPINNGKELYKIEIKNSFRVTQNLFQTDLVVQFTEVQLKRFALFIADSYLNEVNRDA